MKSERPYRKMSFWLKRDCNKNDYEAVKKYIEKHKDNASHLDVETEDGQSLFAWCFENGHNDLVKLLLAVPGCHVDGECLNKFPAQAAALAAQLVSAGHQSQEEGFITERLFKCHTFNVNIKYNGDPLLFLTIRGECNQALKAILEHPLLDVTLKSETNTALTEAVATANELQFAMLLSDERFILLVNEFNNQEQRMTPLVKAIGDYKYAHQRATKKINRLLDVPGINVVLQDRQGETALSLMASQPQHEQFFMQMLRNNVKALLADDPAIIKAAQSALSHHCSRPVKLVLIRQKLHYHVDVFSSAYVAQDEELMNMLLSDDHFNPYLQMDSGDNYVTLALKNNDMVLFNRLKKCPLFQADAFIQHQRTFVTAITVGNFEVAGQLMSDFGVDPNCYDHESNGALHKLAARNEYDRIVQFLKIPYTLINQINGNGETLLHVLIRNNISLDAYLDLPELNLNAINVQHETPLNLAVKLGNREAALTLLNKHFSGCPLDVNLTDISGNTPLANLLKTQWNDVIDLLLKVENVNINSVNSAGKTILMIACELGEPAMVKRLLEIDPGNVNAMDVNGDTALTLLARCQDHVGIARMLIEKGANTGATNRQGLDALRIAAGTKHQCLASHFSMFQMPVQQVDAPAPSAPPMPKEDEVKGKFWL